MCGQATINMHKKSGEPTKILPNLAKWGGPTLQEGSQMMLGGFAMLAAWFYDVLCIQPTVTLAGKLGNG